MPGMKVLIALLLIATALPTMAKDKIVVQVQVVSAKTRTWTTVWHNSGSPGTQNTNCTSTSDTTANCTTTTTGYQAPSNIPINHIQVDVQITMPDGNSVTAQCHNPPIWAACFEPQPGTYDARIEKHSIYLIIPTQGRPEYNKDGTMKKAGKVGQTEIKFSFE